MNCGAIHPCLCCDMSAKNTVHTDKNQYGYHKFVPMKHVPEDETAEEKLQRIIKVVEEYDVKYMGDGEPQSTIFEDLLDAIADVVLAYRPK